MKPDARGKTGEEIAPTVMEQIRAMMDRFTKRQRMLAEYMVQRPEKVGFLSISELAANAGVSVATVVRFCNRLGYSGYIELGRKVQTGIQNDLSMLDRFQLSQRAASMGKKPGDSAFERVLALEMESLAQLARSIRRPDFFKCVKWMGQARHVAVIGCLASAGLAEYFAYAAAKVLPSVQSATSGGARDAGLMKELDENALVFVLAFPRYPAASLKLGQLAQKAGAKIVAVTDSLQSPAIQLAHLSFLISISASAMIDAYAAPVTFINALITQFAEENPEKSRRALAHFETFASGMDLWLKKEK